MDVSEVRRDYRRAALDERDLAPDPIAQFRAWLAEALAVFYWPANDRQVRVEGTVEKTSREETAAYFATRPPASQLGAWASRQSAPVAGREPLEQAFAAVAARFAGGEVPAPEFWGGYRLEPTWVEFWQGRESRLHDRIAYRRNAEGGWTIERLQP